jgi:hypothetical protein
MQHLARVFAGGSNHGLVAQLVETAEINPADLMLLRKTAAGTTPPKTKGKSK